MKAPKIPIILCSIGFLIGLASLPPGLYAQVGFPGPELLGRPTDTSVTVNVVADASVDAYFKYGTTSGSLTRETGPVTSVADEPIEVVIDGLTPDTRYYYQMVYRETGTSDWLEREEHTFHTQRAPGSTFTFTIITDSHPNVGIFFNTDLYEQTFHNVLADEPDFHLDLGDTFAMDWVYTVEDARGWYLYQRPFMGIAGHSVPIFLVIGNHENEEGWNLDDTPPQPILSVNARKRYYPNPITDGFFSANTDTGITAIEGDHLMENYYAWHWGDALFVALDPNWYTMIWPSEGQAYGGEGMDGEAQGDRWDWTLGGQQYLWLKQTLETSNAPFKFVFIHHLTGGVIPYGRGGTAAAPYFEWGGYNWDDTWGFDTERPGWETPIHQLLVENGVTLVFHGHDHCFAFEELNGIVYQECPMPANSDYDFTGFCEDEPTWYPDADILPNSGHIRVTVSPTQATVDYVRAYLPGGGTNGEVAYSYILDAPITPCRGDFNFDGTTDEADLAVFAADLGRTDCSGDCEGDFEVADNDVDGSDLALFIHDYGRTDCPVIVE